MSIGKGGLLGQRPTGGDKPRCVKCRKRPPITGSDLCYFDSPETEAEAEGRPIVTAEAKLASRTRGGLIAGRRLAPEEDVTVDVRHRLDTLEEIGQVEAQLRVEIRARQWSHRDAALQVSLLLTAIRRVEAIEKLRAARDRLTQGRRPPTVRVIFPQWLEDLAQRRPMAARVALPPGAEAPAP